MSHLLAIEKLPVHASSYDLWEFLRRDGLEPTILALTDERVSERMQLFLEFPDDVERARAHELLRVRGAVSRIPSAHSLRKAG